MRMTLEKTDTIIQMKASSFDHTIFARLWTGRTSSGIEVQALITRIAANRNQNIDELDRELKGKPAPSPIDIAFPLRLII